MLQWCFFRVISWLYNPQKMRVFSFIRLMWQFFKTLLNSFLCLTWTSLNPNLIFNQNHPISNTNLCKISSKVCFLTFFSSFYLRLCRICFRVLKLGIFEKGVGNYDFGKKNFKILIGLCPIVLIVSVLVPCSILVMYLSIFSYVYALPICVV